MKKLVSNLMMGAFAAMLSVSFASCEGDNTRDDGSEDALYEAVLKEYVNTTVIPTYKALAEAALEMRTANIALKAAATDANMKAASDAWMKARIEWELSEAFLFGPVSEDYMDIDAHIDSWPLELETIKKELNDANGTLTGARAWKELDSEVIGFHVTEYLLYRDGKSRPAADLTAAELNYLTAATDALVWDCVLAYVAWAGEENVSAAIKAVYRENTDVVNKLEVDNAEIKNYGSKLKTAAVSTSWSGALQEIIDGVVDIADEVGATKILSPYEAKDVTDVESWYSWHSLDDYQNNIHSIKNAYLGGAGVEGTRTSVSLSAYVKSKDADLDQEILTRIETAISKIKAIGNGGLSFYEVVDAYAKGDNSKGTVVRDAATACQEIGESFEKIKDLLK